MVTDVVNKCILLFLYSHWPLLQPRFLQSLCDLHKICLGKRVEVLSALLPATPYRIQYRVVSLFQPLFKDALFFFRCIGYICLRVTSFCEMHGINGLNYVHRGLTCARGATVAKIHLFLQSTWCQVFKKLTVPVCSTKQAQAPNKHSGIRCSFRQV